MLHSPSPLERAMRSGDQDEFVRSYSSIVADTLLGQDPDIHTETIQEAICYVWQELSRLMANPCKRSDRDPQRYESPAYVCERVRWLAKDYVLRVLPINADNPGVKHIADLDAQPEGYRQTRVASGVIDLDSRLEDWLECATSDKERAVAKAMFEVHNEIESNRAEHDRLYRDLRALLQRVNEVANREADVTYEESSEFYFRAMLGGLDNDLKSFARKAFNKKAKQCKT